MNIEAFFKITYGLYVVSSRLGEKLNGFISNTVFQVTSEPAQFAIACSKNNFTALLIEQSRIFSISALKKECRTEIMSTFGYKSGKDINKFEGFDYKLGKTGSPILLEDTLSWFECEVVDVKDLGTHLLFIGKVIDGDLIDGISEPLTYAYYREVKKGKAPKNAPTYIDSDKLKKQATIELSGMYECTACGHIYDPAKGDPESGIAPGTPFEALPDNWVCPVCGAEKADFIRKN
jgi:flavin reductase (DIM6/NTAB) family NADH-FMN oxidoreductase RutF/rubredoxin